MEIFKLNNAADWIKLLLRGTLQVLLFAVLAFLAISQDWISVSKQGAVSSVKVEQVEGQIQEIRREYVRREGLDPRLTALEKRVDEMREEQKVNSRKIDQILFELRRR